MMYVLVFVYFSIAFLFFLTELMYWENHNLDKNLRNYTVSLSICVLWPVCLILAIVLELFFKD